MDQIKSHSKRNKSIVDQLSSQIIKVKDESSLSPRNILIQSEANNQQMMSMFPHLTHVNENTLSHEKLKDFKDYTVLKPMGIEELVNNSML